MFFGFDDGKHLDVLVFVLLFWMFENGLHVDVPVFVV